MDLPSPLLFCFSAVVRLLLDAGAEVDHAGHGRATSLHVRTTRPDQNLNPSPLLYSLPRWQRARGVPTWWRCCSSPMRQSISRAETVSRRPPALTRTRIRPLDFITQECSLSHDLEPKLSYPNTHPSPLLSFSLRSAQATPLCTPPPGAATRRSSPRSSLQVTRTQHSFFT